MKNEAIENLRGLLNPGDTIYTQVTHVSAPGMSRNIKVMLIRDNQPQNITYWVAQAIDCKMSKNGDGLKISGCGMDMTFEVVYNLGRVLWPDGFKCVGKQCHSNDHGNGMRREFQYDENTCPGRQNAKKCVPSCDHVGIPDVLHKDGGYALINRNL